MITAVLTLGILVPLETPLLFLTITVNLVQFDGKMNICQKMQKGEENITLAPISIMLITDRYI